MFSRKLTFIYIDRQTCTDERHYEIIISENGVSSSSFSKPQHLIASAHFAFGDLVFLAQLTIESCCFAILFFRRPLCCTGRRHTEKNKRKVGREK